jgi:hypothetical protein
MAIIKNVRTYAAFRYPNSGQYIARINCHAVQNYRLYIMFKPDGHPLPQNVYDSKKGEGYAYDHASSYPAYIDLLRNEKPISVAFNENGSFALFAAREEVGEGELSQATAPPHEGAVS